MHVSASVSKSVNVVIIVPNHIGYRVRANFHTRVTVGICPRTRTEMMLQYAYLGPSLTLGKRMGLEAIISRPLRIHLFSLQVLMVVHAASFLVTW